MRAFVRYDNQGIIVPTSFVMKKTMPKVGQWKEISTSKSVSGFPAQSSQKNLRAFVRYNGKNKVVPGSVVVRGQVPVGNFSEVTYDLSRPLVPEPTTTTTTSINSGYQFSSKLELQTAVDLWVSNEAQAIMLYGEINTWNVSNVTDMSSLFLNKTTFNSDISNWNMSNVTDMSYMFSRATTFNQPIENWNVSSVSNMEAMFSIQSNFSPGSFNQPLDNWNTSNLTNTNSMFVNQGSFQGLGLQNWDMSNVTSSPEMFKQCSSLTNVALENWDVGNIFDMRGMFKDCINYNRDLSSWSVNNVTLCLDFSDGATSWTLPKPTFTNCTP